MVVNTNKHIHTHYMILHTFPFLSSPLLYIEIGKRINEGRNKRTGGIIINK